MIKLQFKTALCAIFLLLPSICLADAVRISGATTVASAIIQPMQSQIEADSGTRLNVVSNGTAFGITDLIQGRSDVAMISAPLALTLAKMKEQNSEMFEGVELHAHQIGATQIAFIAHPSIEVDHLSLEQIERMLDGAITNWDEVGGASHSVTIVAERSGGGLRNLAEKRLTQGNSITGTLREFVNATQVPVVVAQLPGALGIAAPNTSSRAAVRILRTDEVIEQPLILVTLGEPTAAVAAVIKAARAAGKG